MTFEKVLETASDDKELEKEQEVDKFQEINQKKFPYLSLYHSKKKPSLRKPLSVKVLPVKFKTPPPEILS